MFILQAWSSALGGWEERELEKGVASWAGRRRGSHITGAGRKKYSHAPRQWRADPLTHTYTHGNPTP